VNWAILSMPWLAELKFVAWTCQFQHPAGHFQKTIISVGFVSPHAMMKRPAIFSLDPRMRHSALTRMSARIVVGIA
jgi:hypothetical protein